MDKQRRYCLMQGAVWARASMLLHCGVGLPALLANTAHAQAAVDQTTVGQGASAPFASASFASGVQRAALPELFTYADALFRSTQVDECLGLLAESLPMLTGPQAHALVLDVPDMADNGAAVPVAVRWQGPVAKAGQAVEIAILVDKNPFVLSMRVNVPSMALPAIKTRIKLNQSCDVYAFLKINKQCFVVRKPVRVTLGGCVA